jgi:transcriptional regulator with XRE-family HTH domain
MRLPAIGLLPALRRYLGLTQPRMAELLGTSRLAIAHAEASTRSLPVTAHAALTALLAALPPELRRTLTRAPGYAPPPPAPTTLVPPPAAASALASRRHLAGQELRRTEAALAKRRALAAAGNARLALLAAPAAPSLGSYRTLFELEARSWNDEFAQADMLLLHARGEALRLELALLSGTAPKAQQTTS